jgi:malonyl-CoA O-methyltransferase
MSPPAPTGLREVHALALRRHQQRVAALTHPHWLHEEVARRMAQRLPVIRHRPKRVLNWQAAISGSAKVLARAYPKAQIVSQGVPQAPVPRAWWRLGLQAASATAGRAGGAQAAADLVWANMALHFDADPPSLMQAWKRALAPEGFLMFSTLGPGSLREVQKVFDSRGWGPAFAPFVDMHDLGDMLVNAGFADPVMDQEILSLHWADAQAMLNELRTWGGNAAVDRFAGLRARGWKSRLEQALQTQLANLDGRPMLQLELVYGHAFQAAPRAAVAPQTTLPLDDMRQMLRNGRRP